MNTTAKKLLYTIDEASDALSLGRTTLYAEINKGNIFSLKVGKRRMVPVASLEKWIEKLAKDQADK